MSLIKDIFSLEPGAIVDLYEIDVTPIDPAAGISRFHAGTNNLGCPVVWQGHLYAPRPVQATGFGLTAQGAAPRPKLQISNIPGTPGAVGVMTLLNKSYDDLVGAIVTRRRTLVKYLDAANFPGGVNPDADPTAELPLDVYHVNRRLTENRLYCEYELASIYDLEGVLLPVRQVIKDTCGKSYRFWDAAAGHFAYTDSRGVPVACPYTGAACYDRLGNPVDDPAKDVCGHRLSDCQKRFATSLRTLDNVVTSPGSSVSVEVPVVPPDGSLPFGGFPGAGRYR